MTAYRLLLVSIFLALEIFLFFVASQFRSIFNSMNVELGTVTQLIVTLSQGTYGSAGLMLITYIWLDRRLVRVHAQALEPRAGGRPSPRSPPAS